MRTGVIGVGLLFLVIGLILWLVANDEPESAVRVAQPFVTGPELQQEDSPTFEDVIEPASATADEQEIAENVGSDESAEIQFDETHPSKGSTSELLVKQESEVASEPLKEAVAADADIELISIERNADGERNYITVDAGGFDELSLTFSDECWVEVSDRRHGSVYYDLNRDGDVLTVFGSLPFEVLLGKATGVEMLYNGGPFDLEPYIGLDKTAKIKISD